MIQGKQPTSHRPGTNPTPYYSQSTADMAPRAQRATGQILPTCLNTPVTLFVSLLYPRKHPPWPVRAPSSPLQLWQRSPAGQSLRSHRAPPSWAPFNDAPRSVGESGEQSQWRR
ncbi:hypothetical protein XENTR_v10006993 [Xenopus tropicalis]|nr:hypothetical protein XENTR_v10006993 [Xenopus tropicalis]